MLEPESKNLLSAHYTLLRNAEAFCSAPQTVQLGIRLQTTLQTVRPPLEKFWDSESHRLPSPIQRLPPELLQLVFAFCLAEYPGMNSAEAPLLLGRICRSWRDIAYGTGDLWSAIRIIVAPINRSTVKLTALKDWLSRSAGYPLHIFMQTNDPAVDISSFLDVLIPLSPRWERMTLVVPNTECFQHLERSFSEGFNRPLPLLSSFELIEKPSDGPPWYTRFSGNLLRSPFRFLNQSPNIRQISIHLSSTARYHSLLSNSVAANVSELDLDYHHMFNYDLGQLLTFLSSFQLLRKLQIRACFTKFASPTSTPQLLHFPQLEYLSVVMSPFQAKSNPSYNYTFLNHIVTPSLLHLTLHDVLFVKDVAVSLTDLFSRSSCSLETLSLRLTDASRGLDLSPLTSCLRYSPSLTKLILDRWDGMSLENGVEKTDAFLLDLAYGSGSVDCCPKLVHLKLAGYARGIDFESLLVLVRSRVRPPPDCARLEFLDLQDLVIGVGGADAVKRLEAVERLRLEVPQGISISFPPALWNSSLCW